ncbi:hypothetical protein [Nocardia testacea]|uniref:hypothetical protein n=1 Tax=Nocardia testacea TaxID=248551 RepID=UPI0033E4DA5C
MSVVSDGPVPGDSGRDPDDLFEEMRNISRTVNSFSSESIQTRVFEILMAWRFGPSFELAAQCGRASPAVPQQPPIDGEHIDKGAVVDNAAIASAEDRGNSAVDDDVPASDGRDEVAEPTKAGGRRRRRSSRRRDPVRYIDFRPDGQTWFRDFVDEKQPSTIDQRNVVAVYWLQYHAEIAEISVGHVLAAYKECSWREPANPDNALQITASRNHWLDTHDMTSIAVTPSGRNVVQYDMPISKPPKR